MHQGECSAYTQTVDDPRLGKAWARAYEFAQWATDGTGDALLGRKARVWIWPKSQKVCVDKKILPGLNFLIGQKGPHWGGNGIRNRQEDLTTEEQIRKIGQTIREIRRYRGLSLQQLASNAGLSSSFLSLVERGRSTLALTSVFSVATALGVGVEDLVRARELRPPAHHGMEIRRQYGKDLMPIRIGDRDYHFLSAHIEGRVLEPLLVTVHPTHQPEEPYSHNGEEFAMVIEGELIYVIQDQEYRLGPGDSIHVMSTMPHALRNDQSTPAKALWVLSQPLVHESLGELTIRRTP